MGKYDSIYRAAAKRYGLGSRGPSMLAAIHEIETGSGSNLSTSSAGAQGHMQFMPGTWAAYGVDASGDGKRDPWNARDAIYSAAKYLKASGAPNSWDRAVYSYNHADWYVRDVKQRSNKYKRLDRPQHSGAWYAAERARGHFHPEDPMRGKTRKRPARLKTKAPAKPTSRIVPQGTVGTNRSVNTNSVTTIIPGVDNSEQRRQILFDYVENRDKGGDILQTGLALRQAQDVPEERSTTTNSNVQRSNSLSTSNLRIPGGKQPKGSRKAPRRKRGLAGTPGHTKWGMVRGHRIEHITMDGKRLSAVRIDGYWVRPNVADRVLFARQSGIWKGRLNDGLRPIAVQRKYYQQYLNGGGLAAAPGQSNHGVNRQGAVDVSDTGSFARAQQRYRQQSGKPGLINRLPTDPVHFSLDGH